MVNVPVILAVSVKPWRDNLNIYGAVPRSAVAVMDASLPAPQLFSGVVVAVAATAAI